MNIVLLTNILTPYRKAFFDEVYKQCIADGQSDFRVICMAAGESDRQWKFEDLREKYTFLLKGNSLRIKNYDIHFCQEVEEMIMAGNPDIIIVSGSYMLPPAWEAVKIAKKNGIKVLFWSESHLEESRGYKSTTKKIREKIRNKFYKKFDGFMYPGEKAKEFIEKYANSQVRLINIPNLIDNRVFDIANTVYSKAILRDKYMIDQCKYVFFSPIRLTHVKGMLEFLELLSKADDKDKCQLVIAGEGELKDEIELKAKEYGIDLIMAGYRCEAEMVELYRCADCFLLPSLADPNPLTCIEAIWNGLPLLVSDHVGNHPEVVKEGKNGYVFSYKHPSSAINSIDAMINSTTSFKRDAADLSYDIAVENFDIEKRTKGFLSELREFVG